MEPKDNAAEVCEGIVELDESQQAKLEEIVKCKITEIETQLKQTHLTQHKIYVQGHDPIRQRCYHVREYRFYLDFSKVNKITKKDLYPIPLMNEILDTLRSAKFISKIDLKSAYLQIPLEENSKPITAFTVPGKGMYQFKRMPFSLTNAPATFQRLMDKVITPDLKPNVCCYLEDIIIVTQNFDDHLKYLSLVLDKINEANITIGLDKCEFGFSEIKYLGFKVNERGLQIDDDKIHPILELLTPKNIKQLQRLI